MKEFKNIKQLPLGVLAKLNKIDEKLKELENSELNTIDDSIEINNLKLEKEKALDSLLASSKDHGPHMVFYYEVIGELLNREKNGARLFDFVKYLDEALDWVCETQEGNELRDDKVSYDDLPASYDNLPEEVKRELEKIVEGIEKIFKNAKFDLADEIEEYSLRLKREKLLDEYFEADSDSGPHRMLFYKTLLNFLKECPDNKETYIEEIQRSDEYQIMFEILEKIIKKKVQ